MSNCIMEIWGLCKIGIIWITRWTMDKGVINYFYQGYHFWNSCFGDVSLSR